MDENRLSERLHEHERVLRVAKMKRFHKKSRMEIVKELKKFDTENTVAPE